MSSFSLLRSFSSDTQSTTTPPKRRINKRFSFHQKQHQSVKDPIEATSMERDKKTKTNLTRRWSSLKQYQTTTLSQQSLATGNCSSSTNTSPMNAASDVATGAQKVLNGSGDVKKKWEVIEHYREALGGRETVSSSLLAVSCSICINEKPHNWIKFFAFDKFRFIAGWDNNFQHRHTALGQRSTNLLHQQKLHQYARQYQ